MKGNRNMKNVIPLYDGRHGGLLRIVVTLLSENKIMLAP